MMTKRGVRVSTEEAMALSQGRGVQATGGREEVGAESEAQRPADGNSEVALGLDASSVALRLARYVSLHHGGGCGCAHADRQSLEDATCAPHRALAEDFLPLLDRVSRERNRQALERAQAAICGYCRDAATWGAAVQNPGPTWNHGERYCAATPIRALSESVASAGKEE